MGTKTTPTANQAVPEPHPRGIFRDPQDEDGRAVFRFYDCTGRQVAELKVVQEWADLEFEAQAWAYLNRRCSPDPSDPHPLCGPRRGLHLL